MTRNAALAKRKLGVVGGEELEEKGAEIGLIQIERTGIFMRRHLPNFGHSAKKSGYLQFAVYRP